MRTLKSLTYMMQNTGKIGKTLVANILSKLKIVRRL